MLIDSCCLIHLASDTLSKRALAAMSKAPSLHHSAVSCYEIAFTYGLGKLPLPYEPRIVLSRLVERYGLTELMVNSEISLLAGELEILHCDPFDRYIIATAMREALPVLTLDRRFADYGVEVIPA